MNQLKCNKCKEVYPLDEPRWKCDCGSILDIEFESIFDLDKIKKRKPTIWRYREAIPIQNDENIISFDEGCTRLKRAMEILLL